METVQSELLRTLRDLVREASNRKLDVRKDYSLMVALRYANDAIDRATKQAAALSKAG